MGIQSEHRGISRGTARGMEAFAARVPTSRALGIPCRRGPGATPVPRSGRRLALALAVLSSSSLAACQPYVQGDGVYREERRPDPGPFTGVLVESGIGASVAAGAGARSVTVSGDANVVPYIETEVRTDSGRQVLHVWISKAFIGTIPPRAVVEVPSLEYASATESSRIAAKGVAAVAFEAVADKRASLVLQGAALPAGESIDVRLSSGAVLDASAYGVSGGASVQLSGGSAAKLECDGPVTGTVTGGSELDNLAGAGSCAGVSADGSSKLSCR
jgi:Putative auto-transporter adhesin, head GIN domain